MNPHSISCCCFDNLISPLRINKVFWFWYHEIMLNTKFTFKCLYHIIEHLVFKEIRVLEMICLSVEAADNKELGFLSQLHGVNLFLTLRNCSASREAGIFHNWRAFFTFTKSPAAFFMDNCPVVSVFWCLSFARRTQQIEKKTAKMDFLLSELY